MVDRTKKPAIQGSRTPGFRYDAFISYNRRADSRIAEALQKSIENVARRPFRGRPLEIFRDLTDMPIGDLSKGIYSALDESAFLILLANRQSARAEWVNREIAYWIQRDRHDPELLADRLERLLVLRTSEEPLPEILPPALHEYLAEGRVRFEPAWTDLTWARADELLDLDNLRFRQTAAEIAGRLLGTRQREIFDRQEQSVRRSRRWVRGVIVSLITTLALLLGLLTWANDQRVDAVEQSVRADDQHRQALARQLAAESATLAQYHPAVARDLALLSLRVGVTSPVAESLAAASAATRLPVARSYDGSVADVEQGGDLTLFESGQNIWIWSHNQRSFVPISVGATAVAISSTGDRFATADSDRIVLWDARSPSEPVEIAASEPLLRGIDAIEFSPDGSRLSTVDTEGVVTMWSVADAVEFAAFRNPVRTGPAPAPAMRLRKFRLSLSAAGQQAVTTDTDGRLRWWDLSNPNDPRLTHSWQFDPVELMAAVPTDDGHVLAAGITGLAVSARLLSPDGTTRRLALPDSAVKTPEQRVPYASDSAPFVAISPKADLIALTDYSGRLRVWDSEDPDSPVITNVLESTAVYGLRFSASGGSLLGYSHEHGLLSFAVDPPVRQRILAAGLSRPGASRVVMLIPGGNLLFFSSDEIRQPGQPPGEPGPTESGTSAGIGAVPAESQNNTAPVVAVAADDSVAFIGDYDGDVAVWDMTDTPTVRWQGHLLQRSQEGQIGEPLHGFDQVSTAALSPDGTLLATSNHGNVRLWDVPNADHPERGLKDRSSLFAAVPGTPGGWSGGDAALAFSPDNGLLAVHGARTTLWDVSDRSQPRAVLELKADQLPPRKQLPADIQRAPVAAFSADGGLFAGTRSDGSITIWRVDDPKRPVELGTLLGHAGEIQALAFHPDGRTLASAGVDGTIRLWDVGSQGVSVTPGLLSEEAGDVRFLAFPGDGDRLVAGATNRGIQTWDLSPERLRASLCADLTQPLSEDLLRRYTDNLVSAHPCD